jgi:type VI secretion system protein VasG
MVIIPYYALQDEAMRNIIRLKLGKIQRRIRENHKIDLNYNEAVVDAVAKRCTEVESGARNVDNILTNTLLPDVSRQILGQMAEGGQLQSINVTMGENGEFVYQ